MFWIGAVVSLCYVPGVTGAYIATQWPVLSILLPGVWLWSFMVPDAWRAGPTTAFHWAGLLFIAYAAVRLRYSIVVEDGVSGLWMICIMGLSFWLGSTLDRLRDMYAGLAVGAVVSSLVAVFQAAGAIGIPYVSTAPAGIYANSVAQGTILALVMIALISEQMWTRAILLIPGVMLSNSRGALLALGVGLACLCIRRVWVLGIVAVAGAVTLVQPLSTSDDLRVAIWRAAASSLTWLGWGPGSFTSLLLPYRGGLLPPEYAHNDALQLAFEYGVAAAIPIGVLAFVLTRTREREWPILAAFAAAGCYSMPLWMPVASFMACVAAGRVVRGWALARGDGYARG